MQKVIGVVKATEKRIWDNYEEVMEVQKSDHIKYVIAAAVRDGVRYVNIREFYFARRNNRWTPSYDGITIPLEVPIERGTKILKPFGEFVSGIIKASEVAKTLDLEDLSKAVYVRKEYNNED